MLFFITYDLPEIEYKNIDSMVDRYPAFNQGAVNVANFFKLSHCVIFCVLLEKEYKDHEATADRYQAFAQGVVPFVHIIPLLY